MEELKRIRLEKEAENPFYLHDTKLLEIYNKCLPPKESYYYFPKGEEIMTIHHKEPIKSIRRVFYNMKYTDYEYKMLNQLKEIINSHSELKMPDYFIEYFILMFVYARGGDLNESYNLIVEYIKFSQKMFPLTISPNSKIVEILNKGFIYIYGRDNRFRPLLICQAKIFEKHEKEYQIEELLQATSFLCQFLINNMVVPGQFETWDMLVNLKGVSVISLPDSLKKLIPALSKYFLCRLNKTFIIGLNFITRILYKIAVNFIDPITATKIIVLDGKGDPKLFKFIRPDNIEEQFGGTAPNMPIDCKNGFFPPRMPSPNFIKDEENKNDILITEDEYIKRFKNGKIPQETVKAEETKQKEKIKELNRIKKEKEECRIKNIIIQKQKILRKQKLIEEKKAKFNKIEKFVKYNWRFDEEIWNKKNYNLNHIKTKNIIKDINKFGRKKETYTRKIFSLNS